MDAGTAVVVVDIARPPAPIQTTTVVVHPALMHDGAMADIIDFGYHLGRPWWKRGFMSKAVR